MKSTYTVNLSADTWAAERGYWQYSTEYGNKSGYFDTREQAIDDLFSPYGGGGYMLAWYGEGFMLCADCAKAEFLQALEDNEPFTLQRELLDGDTHAGEYCDGGCMIVEPHCVDCATEVSIADAPVFYDESSRPICRTCLAKQVVAGFATKTDRLSYKVSNSWDNGVYNGAPWYGSATYRAA